MNAAQLDIILFALIAFAVFGALGWIVPKIEKWDQQARRRERLERWKR